MLDKVFIARQPIVDVEGQIYAFELLFRDLNASKENSAEGIILENSQATARVLLNVLNQFGIKNIIGSSLAFINVDDEFIFSDIILNIPKELFIIEILEHVKVTPSLLERVIFLKGQGYNFALDDVTFDQAYIENFSPLFPHVDVMKIDITLTTIEQFKEKKNYLLGHDMLFLAEKVETKEEFERYKELGCSLFQGYFFAKPEIKQQTSIDPMHQSIIHLTNIINSASSTLDDIVKAFDQEPGVSLQLLKFLNSAQFSFKSGIKSIRQVITLLGKTALRNWLYLLAFSSNSTAVKRPPILDLALTRSQMMERICLAHKNDRRLASEAAFVGILSLIENIFHTPLPTILNELTLDQTILDALLHGKGVLADYLAIVVALEQFEVDDCQSAALELGLSLESIQDIMYASYSAINKE